MAALPRHAEDDRRKLVAPPAELPPIFATCQRSGEPAASCSCSCCAGEYLASAY
jgi:hypothetical protein